MSQANKYYQTDESAISILTSFGVLKEDLPDALVLYSAISCGQTGYSTTGKDECTFVSFSQQRLRERLKRERSEERVKSYVLVSGDGKRRGWNARSPLCWIVTAEYLVGQKLPLAAHGITWDMLVPTIGRTILEEKERLKNRSYCRQKSPKCQCHSLQIFPNSLNLHSSSLLYQQDRR